MVRVCMGWDVEGGGGGGNDFPHIYTDKDYAMHKYNNMAITLSDMHGDSYFYHYHVTSTVTPNPTINSVLEPFLKQPCHLPLEV